MRPQTLLVVILALLFGGVAALGAFLLAGTGDGQGPAMTTIVVATVDLPRGSTITAETVAVKPWPKTYVPEGAILKLDDAVGRSALTSLITGETILEPKLAPKGARGPTSLIKNGMRLITIPTPSVSSNLPGFIEAGSRVDILWTAQDSGRNDQSPGSAAPLLENVEVFAVDGKIDAPANAKADAGPIKSVTVQVKLEDSAKLAPALTRGTIHLSLRNPGDEGRVPYRPPPPPSAPARRSSVEVSPSTTRTIRTIRGTREGVVRIEVPDPAFAAK